MAVSFFNKGYLESLFSMHRNNDAPITPCRLLTKVFIRFAACCCTSYNNDEEWVKPFHLRLVKPWGEQVFLSSWPGEIKPHDYCYFDEGTGLKVSVFEDQKEVIVAFGAHNSGVAELPQERAHVVAERQSQTIIENLKGETPYLYEEALQVFKALREHPRFQGKRFTLCGQSFGGSIAEYVGLSAKVATYCFNSIMLGRGLQKMLPEQNLKDAPYFIYLIAVENDFASDMIESFYGYQWVAGHLGLPRHFGRRYVLPSAYSSIVDRHIYMMGSLMHHLGYSCRTKTTELSDCDILPRVLTCEEIREQMKSLFDAITVLRACLVCPDDEAMKKSLAVIKQLSPSLYAFLCYLVWAALGKQDCGEMDWGETRLLKNPRLIQGIMTPGGEGTVHLLIDYCSFLIRCFQLIPAAKKLSKGICDQLGIPHFQWDAEHLSDGVFMLQLFLSDQLRNGLSSKAKEGISVEKEYALVPRENLLATRFLAIQEVFSKRVLIVSVEYLGVLKVGGLAEAVYGMASGLKERGHAVTLIMPKFDHFPQEHSIENTGEVVEHDFEGLKKNSLFQGRVGDIQALFLGCENRFDLGAEGIYKIAGDDFHATQLKERFAYFGSALAAWIYQMREKYDAVIFNDWHGALAIYLIVKRYFEAWMHREIPALVYVFHNNGYAAQGVLDNHSQGLFKKLGVNTQHLNVTEQSLHFADHCCTVSPSYAEEVQQREGNGLSQQMRKAAGLKKLTGIANGANAKAFNPEADPALQNWVDPETKMQCPLHFGPQDDLVSAKGLIKQQLQKWLSVYHPHYIEEFGVDVTREKILLFVGRYDSSQKGLEKFKQALYAAKEQGATLIVMGSFSSEDDARAPEILAELQSEARRLKGPDWGGALILLDKVNAAGKYDLQQGTVDGIPGIGSLVRAIATFGFFPSKYEPCGLVQFESWLFGSLVITSAVGGFFDTVSAKVEEPAFNGFTFQRFEYWDSTEQDLEIRKKVVEALQYWDRLSADQRQTVMSRVIFQARSSSWTSSANPEQVSPIMQYERVLNRASACVQSRIHMEAVNF